jgi:hypothetical protein
VQSASRLQLCMQSRSSEKKESVRELQLRNSPVHGFCILPLKFQPVAPARGPPVKLSSSNVKEGSTSASFGSLLACAAAAFALAFFFFLPFFVVTAAVSSSSESISSSTSSSDSIVLGSSSSGMAQLNMCGQGFVEALRRLFHKPRFAKTTQELMRSRATAAAAATQHRQHTVLIGVLTGQSSGELKQAAVSASMGKRSTQKRRTQIDPLASLFFTSSLTMSKVFSFCSVSDLSRLECVCRQVLSES